MGTGTRTEMDLGGSLAVGNVEALAAKSPTEIPRCYLRLPAELGEIWSSGYPEIPIIDISKLGDSDRGSDNEMDKLHTACKEWGFFQLTNHGIPEEVIQQLKIDTEEFFNLSLNEKMACTQLPNDIEGYGQAFVQSEEQKLDWGDMLFLLAQLVSIRNFRFWPKHPASFRATMENYLFELVKVVFSLPRAVAKNLRVDPNIFANLFEGGVQGIRINYYPPCVKANRVKGLTPHSDATGVTLLLQANDIDGLHIKKNGKWLPIKPVPGALIINIGDITEIMSRGKYKSIEYRATVNPDK